ncbi:MAG: hypothetical protein ACRDBO_05195 [Lachnospiraceae bacterium]
MYGGLIRHYDVTGKCCPKWLVDSPTSWEQFKQDVSAKMAADNKKSGWHEEDGGWRFYIGNTALRRFRSFSIHHRLSAFCFS